MQGSPRLWFATSNDNKFEEAKFVLENMGIHPRRLSSKGQELQSTDPSTIVANAAEAAYRVFRKPLIVEDTGLFVVGLRGFPGTYASFVYKTIGVEGMLRLLEGVDARKAEFLSAVAYRDGSTRTAIFTGKLEGTIALHPAGLRGFGFDPIFVPREYSRTLGQMTLREKCSISHRAIALRSLGAWLKQICDR